MKKIAYILPFLFVCLCSYAQDDTDKKTTLEDSMDIVSVIDSSVTKQLIDSIANATDFSSVVTSVGEQELSKRINGLVDDVKIPYSKPIKGFVDYFTVKNRNYIRVMLNRKELYFPIFEKYLREYGMPDELKYLSIVESGLNPRARSFMGAVGLWQFMPFTGKTVGLTLNAHVDERMDPEKATIAACKYLKQLYNIHGSWELAIAAYNCGPGNVRKAIRKARSKNIWTVYKYLPKETKGYVPSFMAVKYSMNYHAAHGIFPDTIEHMPKYAIYTVQHFLNIDLLAKQMNVCTEDLVKLNPELRTIIIPEHIKNYPLRVPADKIDILYASHCEISDMATCVDPTYLSQIESMYKMQSATVQRRGNNAYYIVKKGDSLGKIALRFNASVTEIKTWNRLKGTQIKPGQRLVVSKNGLNKTVASATPQKIAAPQKGAKYHLVQEGDTLWNISKKYEGLTIEKIKKLNNLSGNAIQPGQKLRIS